MCHPEVPEGQVTPEVHHEEIEVPLRGGESMPALFCSPERMTGPGILIINDIQGRSPFYESLAARLATAGYQVLLPEFFHREGPLAERNLELARARRGKLNEERTLSDLNAGINWLRSQPNVTGDKTGTIGFCMGGTFVLDLAARRQDLASVCFYGFPASGGGAGVPAPAPLSLVNRMYGPLIGFWGDQDAGVGMDNVEALAKGLEERKVDFKYTVYPGLGHGFMAASRLDPSHDAYEKACNAWTQTVEFYRENLGAK